jgi:hypothetical protein
MGTKFSWKRPVGRHKSRRDDDIRTDLKATEFGLDSSGSRQGPVMTKGREFTDQLGDNRLLKTDSAVQS